jgi:hypothetical protein
VPSGLPAGAGAPSALKETRHEVVFYVNGKRHAPKTVEPDLTLIDYLRDQGLTGTKLACGEGPSPLHSRCAIFNLFLSDFSDFII